MDEQVNHFYDVVQTDDDRHFKCKLCDNVTRHDVTVNARYRHLFRKHKDAWDEHLQSVRGPKKTPKSRKRNEAEQAPLSVSAESYKPTTPGTSDGAVEGSSADLSKRLAQLLNSVGAGAFSESGNEASSAITANSIDATVSDSIPGPVSESGLTSFQFPHHGQFQSENTKHALDDGTKSPTDVKRFRPLVPTENKRLPPVHSLRKTTTDSSYTHATTSGFNGGELLSYGRNVTVGPPSSLELKLDQVIDLMSQIKDSVNQSGNMMAMLLRSNLSGSRF